MGGGFMYIGEVSSDSASSASVMHPLSTAAAAGSPLLCGEPSAYGASAMACENTVVRAFGPVPSREEVAKAISELDRFMNGHTTSQIELDGRRGLLSVNDQPKVMQVPGYPKFLDSFHTMRTEPSFQNMVVSLSSDKAVWEAILSNKAVQDLQGNSVTAKEERLVSSMEEPDILILIWKWILGFAKTKVFELADKFRFLVNDMLQFSPEEKPTSELINLLEEKIRSSFVLSVVMIMIVVATRNPSLLKYMNS